MKKLYKYTGTVSAHCYRRNNPNALPFMELVLSDLHDDDKAPIKIEAVGGLADYINAIEGTDAEERYLTADWYYDSLLYLQGRVLVYFDTTLCRRHYYNASCLCDIYSCFLIVREIKTFY